MLHNPTKRLYSRKKDVSRKRHKEMETGRKNNSEAATTNASCTKVLPACTADKMQQWLLSYISQMQSNK